MYPRPYRLRLQKDIDRVFKEGRIFWSKSGFGIKYGVNSLPHSRFTVVISAKVSKKAVVRNRYKRIIRTWITQNLPYLKSGYDLIFLTKRELLDHDKVQLVEQLLATFKRIRLWQKVDDEVKKISPVI